MMALIAGSLLLHRSGWLYIAKQSSSAASGLSGRQPELFCFLAAYGIIRVLQPSQGGFQ